MTTVLGEAGTSLLTLFRQAGLANAEILAQFVARQFDLSAAGTRVSARSKLPCNVSRPKAINPFSENTLKSTGYSENCVQREFASGKSILLRSSERFNHWISV